MPQEPQQQGDRVKQQMKAQAQMEPAQTQDQDSIDDQILDLEAVKERIRLALISKEKKVAWDPNQEQHVVYEVDNGDGRQLCNQKAVADFMSTIEGTVNTNIAGSYLDKNDIQSMGRNCMYAIIDQIVANHEEYGIDSIAQAEQIVSIISANLKGAIKKAAGGRILKHGEETTERRVVETREDDDEGILT